MFEQIKSKISPLLSQEMILIYHKLQAILANIWYGFPARKLKVIGVTGTNGKTTTCAMIGSILREAGFKVAEATTVYLKIGKKSEKNNFKMTTLSVWKLQRFLKKALSGGAEYVIVEVTSHALVQSRVWGIKFYASVLTNITRDHLDYHETFTKYINAKLKLFINNPEIAVINLDDSNASKFLKLRSGIQITYALDNLQAQVRASKLVVSPTSLVFSLVSPLGQQNIQLNVGGKFNVSNCLASASLALGLGLTLETVKDGLEKFEGVRGRLEKISVGQDFDVIIDYAHTPDALEKLYETLSHSAKKKIISVFGATGERDKGKRPMLGEIVGRFADIIILTDEDPYTEDPNLILKAVARGVEKNKKFKLNKNYFQILDRKLAIRKAISLAKKGDLVVITGKGHEEKMAVANPINCCLPLLIPFNERDIVKEELRALTKS